MIPEMLYQTASSKTDLHPVLRENVENLRRRNSDWACIMCDDNDCKDFICSAYGYEFLSLYDRISPRYGAARADFFRYLCICKLGGVYLDIKSTVIEPLSSVIPDEAKFSVALG